MINFKDLIRFNDTDRDVRISCVDGQVIIGDVISVDDEEESGLGEPGVSIFTPDGLFMGIGVSEIESIIELETKNIGVERRELISA